MNEIIIFRNPDNGIQTTGLGVIQDLKINPDPVMSFFTVELPWKNNQRGISCIPKGRYKIKKRVPYGNFPYYHYDILETTPREGVKIHAGNYYTQIRGCILVGDSLTDINKDGEKDVTNSKKTLAEIIKLLPRETFLTIK